MVLHAIQTGAIWLTAFMTLFAGTPHFVCRCPNGRIKPFCLTLFSGKTSCCGDSCCSAAPEDEDKSFVAVASLSTAGDAKSCCCCKAHQQNVRQASRTDAKLSQERCRKTFIEGITAVPAPSAKAPMQDLTTHLFALAAHAPTAQEGFGACDHSFANRCAWPPPTDLVTFLQRFLI